MLTQIKAYLIQTVLPPVAATVATWLITHVHVLAEFHLSHDQTAKAIAQLGVFAITGATTWLAGHHVLKGTYAPEPIQLKAVKA